MNTKTVQTVFAIYLTLQSVLAATDKVVCYYQSWTSFAPEDIDTNICTHINYAFLGINRNGTLRLDSTKDSLKRVAALKNVNPNLKVLLSVGGWAEGSKGFSEVAANATTLQNFADSALEFVETYNFDGVDVDWEYPGQRGGISADKENFIVMLRTLRMTLGKDRLVTLAVSSIPRNDSYDAPAIYEIADFVNVMTYDFHGAYDGKTGENSPLYHHSTDTDWERQYTNCNASISNWINAGGDPAKTLLGLAFYGHSYELADPDQHGIGAPIKGVGIGGGGMDYAGICQLINHDDGWTEVYDAEQRVPYIYSGTQWIGYDNPESIGEKVQYAVSQGLGGVMMWAVDGDDTKGNCGDQNPMLRAIQENL